ncbi:MAG: hypothetical protein OEL88_10765 [Sterolibacteriaceae bacterium MAG5]|nr:hypothetical protein [Candidatus Nitricoxidireducens bremensis]
MTAPLPPAIRLVLVAGALLAASGAAWVGADLFSGLGDGTFGLIRGGPVTRDDGFRYWLLVCGEGLAVLVLTGVALTFGFLGLRGTTRG